MRLGTLTIFKKFKHELEELSLKCDSTFDFPSLLFLDEDIIWKHPFSDWEIEDWFDLSMRTFRYVIMSAILRESIRLLVLEHKYIVFNRVVLKYLSFRVVENNVVESDDLLESQLILIVESKTRKNGNSLKLSTLIRDLVNKFHGEETIKPGREFLKAIINKSADKYDWLDVIYNPKGFRHKDDFAVYIPQEFKSKITKDYTRIKEIEMKYRNENEIFKEFCTELDLCIERVLKDKYPDFN